MRLAWSDLVSVEEMAWMGLEVENASASARLAGAQHFVVQTL
jgi:hypothetical protein